MFWHTEKYSGIIVDFSFPLLFTPMRGCIKVNFSSWRAEYFKLPSKGIRKNQQKRGCPNLFSTALTKQRPDM